METKAGRREERADRADPRSRRRRQFPSRRALRSQGRRNSATRAEALAKGVSMRAIAMGGTCTGEHGIGWHKLDVLAQEHGEAVDSMRAIKRALDPDNIMNPGKTPLPLVAACRNVHALHRQQELFVVVVACLGAAQGRAYSVPRAEDSAVHCADSSARSARCRPTDACPAFTIGDRVVWDTLAIAEFLAERQPGIVACRRRCARMGALRDGGDALGICDAAQPISHGSAQAR